MIAVSRTLRPQHLVSTAHHLWIFARLYNLGEDSAHGHPYAGLVSVHQSGSSTGPCRVTAVLGARLQSGECFLVVCPSAAATVKGSPLATVLSGSRVVPDTCLLPFSTVFSRLYSSLGLTVGRLEMGARCLMLDTAGLAECLKFIRAELRPVVTSKSTWNTVTLEGTFHSSDHRACTFIL